MESRDGSLDDPTMAFQQTGLTSFCCTTASPVHINLILRPTVTRSHRRPFTIIEDDGGTGKSKQEEKQVPDPSTGKVPMDSVRMMTDIVEYDTSVRGIKHTANGCSPSICVYCQYSTVPDTCARHQTTKATSTWTNTPAVVHNSRLTMLHSLSSVFGHRESSILCTKCSPIFCKW